MSEENPATQESPISIASESPPPAPEAPPPPEPSHPPAPLDEKEKAALARRAFKIRRRMRAGEEISEEDRAFEWAYRQANPTTRDLSIPSKYLTAPGEAPPPLELPGITPPAAPPASEAPASTEAPKPDKLPTKEKLASQFDSIVFSTKSELAQFGADVLTHLCIDWNRELHQGSKFALTPAFWEKVYRPCAKAAIESLLPAIDPRQFALGITAAGPVASYVMVRRMRAEMRAEKRTAEQPKPASAPANGVKKEEKKTDAPKRAVGLDF